MMISTDAHWKWISTMTTSTNTTINTASATTTRIPTPPQSHAAGKKQPASTSNAAATQQQQHQQQQQLQVEVASWRHQMEIIARLKQESENSETTTTSSSSPTWCSAVVKALRSTDLNTAASHWETAARSGNAVAGVEFARIVLFEQNSSASSTSSAVDLEVVQQALGYLDRGCTAGLPSAMLAVSQLLRGEAPHAATIVAPNLLLSRRWLERAAALDYAPALHELGQLFETGFTEELDEEQASSTSSHEAAGFPRDLVASMRCFKRAADLGFAASLLSLGRLFLLSPDAGPESLSRAEHFLSRAVEAGCHEAMSLLEHCLRRRAELETRASNNNDDDDGDDE